MGSLLGTPVLIVPLPPGTVRLTLLNVTLVTRWLASAPKMVGLNGPLPVPVTLSYVMLLIEPMPGLPPQRLRVPIFCMIGDATPDIVMFR